MLVDNLSHCTVKILCSSAEGRTASGTGFIFSLPVDEHSSKLVLVTNRHVFFGFDTARFWISTKDAQGNVAWGRHREVNITNLQRLISYHPDERIDLAAIGLPPILAAIEAEGFVPHFTHLPSSAIYRREVHKFAGSLEDIVMVGYPIGLWDEVNNLPVARRGVTASRIDSDWNGLPFFLIDCACFPGSSGSPIVLHQRGMIPTDDGRSVTPGERLLFLGVLFAGPQYSQKGEIRIVEVPTAQTPLIEVEAMMHLGYCIKASSVEELVKGM
jgi:hypothetical protein